MVNVADLRERIRGVGLKLTPQRLAIYRILSEVSFHPGVDYVYQTAKKDYPMISLATVYKTLESFADRGLALKVGSVDELKRYDGNFVPHPHVICVGCNSIVDLDCLAAEDITKLETLSAKATGYKVIDNFASFYGYCPDCRHKFGS